MILELDTLNYLFLLIPIFISLSEFIKIYFEENHSLMVYLMLIFKLVILFCGIVYLVYKLYIVNDEKIELPILYLLIQTILTLIIVVLSIYYIYSK